MSDTHTTEADPFASLLSRVEDGRYPVIGQLAVSAWVSKEPLPFEKRETGQFETLELGQRWAEKLFDCAWFRFQGEIPKGEKGELAVRIDINGELCLVDCNGLPLRGLTCVKSVFDRALGTPAKTVYRLPSEFSRPGPFELWADAGLNDLFGQVQNEGRVEFAELCRCRDDVRDLYYDLEVLADWYRASTDNALRRVLRTAIEGAERLLPDLEPCNVALARRHLSPLLSRAPEGKGLQVTAVGHSHLDLAWLWPIRETIRKGARTFATVLYNQNRYQDYVYSVSQPRLLCWMKEHYPSLHERIKQAIAAGRIEVVGSMWVEPDCNLPSGESFVRQILVGRRFLREEYGISSNVGWLPDAFGFNGQLPQILAKSGHPYFVSQKLSWNLVNRFPFHSCSWEGIDGSVVQAHMLPEETYNSPAAPHSLLKIARNYAQAEVSHHALMVYGIGDGGGGPDGEHLERLSRERSMALPASVRLRRVDEFLSDWSSESRAFPRWTGELYLERHQGTYTTQAHAKKYNRRAELMLREIEMVAALCAQYAPEVRLTVPLGEIWREVLLYQFHDILPGSSIKRVYDEVYPRYRTILRVLETEAVRLWTALASHSPNGKKTLAVNTLPWARTEWMKTGANWCLVTVPALGWAPLEAAHGEVLNHPGLFASTARMENELLCASFNALGSLVSLRDKKTGREFVVGGSPINEFRAFRDEGDAWDMSLDYRANPLPAPVLAFKAASVDGPCATLILSWTLGTSQISQKITLRAGSPLLEFETELSWHEKKTMLRVAFPTGIKSRAARFEIPFGSIQRSTREDDSRNRAQQEVSAHQWVDLSEASHGLAVFNDCKYGYRVKNGEVEMSLVRSVPFPGTPLINKADVSLDAMTEHFTDQGAHSFRYALWPHEGDVSEADLTEKARAFNSPLRIIQVGEEGKQTLPASGSILRFCPPVVDVSAYKLPETGEGDFIVRIVNVSSAPANTVMHSLVALKTACSCDLCEEQAEPLPLETDGTLKLCLAPFEVKTLRLKYVR
jgi:alpha-mannosidase